MTDSQSSRNEPHARLKALVDAVHRRDPHAGVWEEIDEEDRVTLSAAIEEVFPSAPSEIVAPWKPASERPEVKLGTEQLCWVAAKRENGKVYVYESWWVNRPVSEEENVEHGWEVQNEDGDPLHCVGWHKMGANSSYDEFFMAEENAQQIVAWMPIAKPEAP